MSIENFREMYYNGGRNARARDDRSACQKEKPAKSEFSNSTSCGAPKGDSESSLFEPVV